ncbi:hypothetical protein G6F37_009355 [Rhizopus arrhizus]|nr:hypothetical protein G6F38_005436 [Rhizopus arrhizus]KAG1154546.1 hypothetical protein G6F37_009355 [Rhizopus arrhizus]
MDSNHEFNSLDYTNDPWIESSTHTTSDEQNISIDNVPESYKRIYNELKIEYDKIEPKYLENILKLSGLTCSIQQDILNLIHLNNNPLFVTQNTFNLFLALVALAQADMDVSLESVNLPTPSFHEPVESIPSPPQTPHDIQQNNINQWLSNLDTVTVSRAPEREGSFLFGHVNYHVQSEKWGTRVLRRFSDFWWLWEVLLKRFPYRLIPHLPPKQFTARTETFEENRRRGLERFINAIARHPVLGKDDIVKVFMSHPSSISSWKMAHPQLSLDDEFIRTKHDIDQLEKMVPLDWEDRARRMKKRSDRFIHQYDSMLSVMRHMIKFKKALGTDYIRYSMTINNLVELDKDCPFRRCQGCPLLAKGQSQIAKSMQQAGMMLNREAMAIADDVMENLIQQRDLFESFKVTTMILSHL